MRFYKLPLLAIVCAALYAMPAYANGHIGVPAMPLPVSLSKPILQTEIGTGAVFKSNSGWNSGKYYCFYNGVPKGTYVRITNTETNKEITALVLDAVPQRTAYKNVLVVVSSAGAQGLQVAGSNTLFSCTVSY